MIKGKLKRLHSPDIDLLNYWPDEEDSFGFLLQFFAGPEDGQGDDSFSITVCTPQWLQSKKKSKIFFASDHLIVRRYALSEIEAFLSRFCERCSGETWREVATKIGRIAHWEFEDYHA